MHGRRPLPGLQRRSAQTRDKLPLVAQASHPELISRRSYEPTVVLLTNAVWPSLAETASCAPAAFDRRSRLANATESRAIPIDRRMCTSFAPRSYGLARDAASASADGMVFGPEAPTRKLSAFETILLQGTRADCVQRHRRRQCLRIDDAMEDCGLS